MAKKTTVKAPRKTANKARPVQSKKSQEDKKATAYDLFLGSDLSQKQICEMIGVSENTFTKWKRDGEWEEQRDAAKLGPKQITAKLMRKMNQLAEASALDADEIAKVASAIDKLNTRKMTVSDYMNAFREFTTYLYTRDSESAKLFNRYQSEFINQKISGN